MPHRCVRCGIVYDDTNDVVFKGCPCGGKLFLFLRKEHLKNNKPEIKLTVEQLSQVEEDVFDMIGAQERDRPVVLDFESVNVVQPGKYELDLVQLFKGAPLIFKLQEGKYIIDIAESFKTLRKK